jgi:hypothetical protein
MSNLFQWIAACPAVEKGHCGDLLQTSFDYVVFFEKWINNRPCMARTK